jgi:hypothetical protein
MQTLCWRSADLAARLRARDGSPSPGTWPENWTKPMKHKHKGGPPRGEAAPAPAHHVVRDHVSHLSRDGLAALLARVSEGEREALALVPLVVSAASAVGNQRVMASLRERVGLPESQRHALTLDLMARSGSVDDATVEQFLTISYPHPGVRKGLAWLSFIRKSSFVRQGAPVPPDVAAEVLIDLEGATRDDLFIMARILHLIDDISDFEVALRGVRGPQVKQVILLEHCASLLHLQAEFNLCAPDRTRSYMLARRMLALFGTGLLQAMSRLHILVRSGYSLLYGGRPHDALKVVDALRSAQQEPAVSGLHANALMALGDIEGAIGRVDAQVRATFAKPPASKSSNSPFNTELAGQILRDVNGVLRRAGLKPFIMSGTLLGYVREGAIMKHDKDFDIGLIGWESQYAATEALLKSKRYRVDPTRLTGHGLFNLPVTHIHSNMSFDLFIYHDKGDHYLHGIDFLVGYTLHFRWTKFDLQEVDFLGDRFYAPSDIDLNMTENYGPGWRTPDPGYHVKLEAPAIANRASHVVNFLAHLEIADAIAKHRDKARLNRLADICEHLLTPGFRPADDLIARLRKGVS